MSTKRSAIPTTPTGVSSELKVLTSVLYDMVLERESTQPFLIRNEIDTIIGNICSN